MMKRYQKTSLSQYVVVGFILFAVLSFTVISSVVMRSVPFEDNFVISWAAGRLWLLEGISPYDTAVIDAAADAISDSNYLAILPGTDVLVDPVITLVFYLPFSLIPYGISRALWVTILAICLGSIGYLSVRLSGWKTNPLERVGSLLLPVVWFPGIYSVLTGQLSPLVIFLVLAALYLILEGQDTTAGFILALVFSSVDTVGLFLLMIVIWSISRKRWSIITAFLAGLAFLMMIFWLLLPSWPLSWLGVIINTYESWDWVKTPLMQLSSVLPGIAFYLSIFLHAGFIIYLMVLWVSLVGSAGLEFIWKTLTVLVVAFLLHVQAAPYHLFLLFPALFLVFRFWSERWGLMGRLFSWLLMMILAGGSWLLVLPELEFTKINSLPEINIGLPLLVFIGMIWIRWWALKVPRVDFNP